LIDENDSGSAKSNRKWLYFVKAIQQNPTKTCCVLLRFQQKVAKNCYVLLESQQKTTKTC